MFGKISQFILNIEHKINVFIAKLQYDCILKALPNFEVTRKLR
jgi:hypothetical protein